MAVTPSWQVRHSAVIGTELQPGATCESAEVVDQPAPSDAGAPSLSRAAVQICVIDRDDDLELSRWLSQRGQTVTTPSRYGTCDVLLLPGATDRQLAYAQAVDLRAEIATTVTTTSGLEAQRRGELARLLAQMRCPSTT